MFHNTSWIWLNIPLKLDQNTTMRWSTFTTIFLLLNKINTQWIMQWLKKKVIICDAVGAARCNQSLYNTESTEEIYLLYILLLSINGYTSALALFVRSCSTDVFYVLHLWYVLLKRRASMVVNVDMISLQIFFGYESSRSEHLIKKRGNVLTAGWKSFNSFIVAYIEVLVVVHAVVWKHFRPFLQRLFVIFFQ